MAPFKVAILFWLLVANAHAETMQLNKCIRGSYHSQAYCYPQVDFQETDHIVKQICSNFGSCETGIMFQAKEEAKRGRDRAFSEHVNKAKATQVALNGRDIVNTCEYGQGVANYLKAMEENETTSCVAIAKSVNSACQQTIKDIEAFPVVSLEPVNEDSESLATKVRDKLSVSQSAMRKQKSKTIEQVKKLEKLNESYANLSGAERARNYSEYLKLGDQAKGCFANSFSKEPTP